ncbi:MAG: hypothetical protein QOD77_673 [Thermoplasmata archaeon]|jgi:hypothetical protein|nr:hypothetical protein [Thermoplasmata archaeon]
MLTGLAILERELGLNEYARHQLEGRLARKLPAAEAQRLRAELEELRIRRLQTIRLLDDLHAKLEGLAAGPD